MTDQHPVTPPQSLISERRRNLNVDYDDDAIFFARWGADQELEACCEWLHWQNLATHPDLIPSLRAARRPKPPNLKEQALAELNLTADPDGAELSRTQVELIRLALESLPS